MKSGVSVETDFFNREVPDVFTIRSATPPGNNRFRSSQAKWNRKLHHKRRGPFIATLCIMQAAISETRGYFRLLPIAHGTREGACQIGKGEIKNVAGERASIFRRPNSIVFVGR